MPSIGWYALLAIGSALLVWKASGLLEGSANRLAIAYGVPAVVQGALIAAVGSSMPELSSAVLATLIHGEFELGVAAIVGSAMFNILVIPSMSSLAGPGTLQSDRDIVYKEALFYMLSVAALLLVFSLAVIYNPVDGNLVGNLTPGLATSLLGLYGLYVFIQVQDTQEYDPQKPPSRDGIIRQWALFVMGLIAVIIGVEGLVRAAIGFGDIFGTPSFFWGLTVIAAGTSLPDMLVSLRAARRDAHATSLANVLGSNVFDLLVAIPAGVIIAGSATIDFAQAVPMMAFLIVGTIALFTIMRTEMELTPREAWSLLILYLGFVGWMLLESFGVTSVVL